MSTNKEFSEMLEDLEVEAGEAATDEAMKLQFILENLDIDTSVGQMVIHNENNEREVVKALVIPIGSFGPFLKLLGTIIKEG